MRVEREEGGGGGEVESELKGREYLSHWANGGGRRRAYGVGRTCPITGQDIVVQLFHCFVFPLNRYVYQDALLSS